MPTERDPADWVGYRPEIKVIDCTIRDGGLMNNHRYDDAVVRGVVEACADGGIDYCELGYKGSREMFDPKEYGPWKFCSEDDVRRIIDGIEHPPMISVMADVGRVDYRNDIVPAEQSPIDLVRVACYIHQVPGALDMVKDAHDKGYDTTINLMALTTVNDSELDSALELFAASEAGSIYVVDSFGTMYSEQVRTLVKRFAAACAGTGKHIGLHAHNNQQLAFANCIEAIVAGANWVDGSLGGLGRGAGNAHTELISGFLHNPKYKMRPLLTCLRDHIEPLRQELGWGFDIPYMLLGQLNQHPRSAMRFNDGPDAGDYVKFYDQIIEEE